MKNRKLKLALWIFGGLCSLIVLIVLACDFIVVRNASRENAPTKLTVSLKVNAEDWTKMQEMFDKHNAEIEAKMRGHIRSVNQMFEEERKKVRERYREYDGIYLGYYAQWIGEFFFFIGVFVVLTVIIMLVGNSAGWFKL